MSQRKTPRAGTPAFRQYVMEQLQRRMLVDAPLQLASDGLDLNDPTAGGLDPALYADAGPTSTSPFAPAPFASDPAPSTPDDPSTDAMPQPQSFGSYGTPYLNVSASSGAEPSTNGGFNFSLTWGAYGSGGAYTTPTDLTVNYSLGGTATQLSDFGLYQPNLYQPAAVGTVVIKAGTSSTGLICVVYDDFRDEPTETVIATAQNGSGYIAGYGSRATVTIADNDTTPTVSANGTSVAVNEGQTATMTGGYGDADGNTVSLSVPVGSIAKTGTSSGTWTWTYPTLDGPDQSRNVPVTANDGHGNTASTGFGLTVNNVAPAFSISGASMAIPGSVYTLSRSAISDPATTDTISGWTIAWGDGQTSNIVGNPSSFTHVYPSVGNIVTIGATARDEDGAYSRVLAVDVPKVELKISGDHTQGDTTTIRAGEAFANILIKAELVDKNGNRTALSQGSVPSSTIRL